MNWNDIKAFYLRGTSLMRLIYINVGAFVLVKLVSLCLILFNVNTASITSYLELPSNLMMLIKQPWSIITYMFMHADVMHIFFNMISLYWFGRIALEHISQKQLVALAQSHKKLPSILIIISRITALRARRTANIRNLPLQYW